MSATADGILDSKAVGLFDTRNTERSGESPQNSLHLRTSNDLFPNNNTKQKIIIIIYLLYAANLQLYSWNKS